MKNAFAVALLLLVAVSAFAQQAATVPAADELKKKPDPDYSKQQLLRMFVANEKPAPDFAIDTSQVGAVKVRSPWLNLLFAYLPFYAPLPGSVPTTTRTMVDPFVMTHTEFPTRPARTTMP